MVEATLRRAFEYGSGLGRAAGGEEGPHLGNLVAADRKRVDPHRLLDPWQRRRGVADVGQVDAAIHHEARVIGRESESAGEMVLALFVLSAGKRDTRADAMTFRIVFIECQCPPHQPVGLVDRISPLVGAVKPAIAISMVVLPEPDGPSSVKNSPRATVSDTSSSAVAVP